jgi:hypothetical protein
MGGGYWQLNSDNDRAYKINGVHSVSFNDAGLLVNGSGNKIWTIRYGPCFNGNYTLTIFELFELI